MILLHLTCFRPINTFEKRLQKNCLFTQIFCLIKQQGDFSISLHFRKMNTEKLALRPSGKDFLSRQPFHFHLIFGNFSLSRN